MLSQRAESSSLTREADRWRVEGGWVGGCQVADIVREQGGGDGMAPFFTFLSQIEPVLHLLPHSRDVQVSVFLYVGIFFACRNRGYINSWSRHGVCRDGFWFVCACSMTA